MRALLHDAAVLHDDDAVHFADRRQAVRHDDGGAALQQDVQFDNPKIVYYAAGPADTTAPAAPRGLILQ